MVARALRGAVAVRGEALDAPAPLLRADGAGLTIEGRSVLSPVDLAFPRGRMVGIIGHNGSGKSTLLKLLARQIQPTVGRIMLGDAALPGLGARAFARQVAYLPQAIPMQTGLTGRELVAFGRYAWHGPLGRIGASGHAAIAEAMRLSGTAPFADRLIDHLSGGERQRVWIAMLIAQDSGFLLLDEPIAALDLAHQIEVLGVLRSLCAIRNAGVILVLHDINMAARFCDEIVALRAGTVAVQGAPSAIMRPDVLQSIYDIPMRVLTDPASGATFGMPA
ncbi:ABC transporter ATP-binding protein [Lichenihabitans psoromatis]|uniref:ABC transporter ATP-binding protein n=1 Tax=Lichenihabitans psoromatis TaxID=2528642 RepID=UPI001036E37B|nr:ATP-binding cassette domain-containing protein [Lichenihabitans psoromatis]